MKTKYKHIHFVEEGEYNGKRVYLCRNNKSGVGLAEVFYYEPWKRYVSEQRRCAVFDAGCQRDMADFLDQLGKEAKDEKN